MAKIIQYFQKSLLGVILFVFCVNCNDQIKYSDNLVFRYNEHKNINSLDPAFAKDKANIWAVNQLFNGLVQMNDSMKVIPSIAKKWEISDDQKLYKFYLRDDVFFHSHSNFGPNKTRAVNASDFDYSFRRIINPKLASPGAWVFNSVKNFKVIDDHTFQIELKYPFAAFLELMTMKYCSVVPKEVIEDNGQKFRNGPIGTGPFFFKKWDENIKLVFRKNKRYFEIDGDGNKLPYLEAVSITFLPEKQLEYSQFLQGKLDFVSGMDASYKDDILTKGGNLNPKYEKKIKMIKSDYLNTEYLGFYLDSYQDDRNHILLRKAFNFGFDRNKMMKYLRNNIGKPAFGGIIPKGLEGYQEKIGYKYNPIKAKKLVEKYKSISKNNSPSFTIATTENYLSICEFIQRSLLDIGIIIKINVMPASALKSAKANGKTDVFRASWIADYPDAQNYLSLFYSENLAPRGPNYTHFKNIKFDSLYELAIKEKNEFNRYEFYKKLDQMIVEEAAVVVLYYDEVVRLAQKNIKNLSINPTNLLNLKYLRKI